MQSQLDQLRATNLQTTRQIEANQKFADAAVKQADAVVKQAEAAIEANKAARETLIAAQRAWVGPRDAHTKTNAKPVAGSDLDIVVDYQNTGREPARNTIFDIEHFVGGGELIVAVRINAYISKCKSIWRPNQQQVVYPSVGFSSYGLTARIPKESVDDAVVNGEKTVYIFGCFSYETFESVHRSWFCFYYDAKISDPQHFNFCLSGNGAD